MLDHRLLHKLNMNTNSEPWGAVCRADSQLTRDIDTMLGQCWTIVYDAGPTLAQHCINVSCLLGYVLDATFVLASNVLSTNIDGAREQKISTQHPGNVGPHIITIGSWDRAYWGGTGGCMCHYCGHVCCMLYVVHGLVWCGWNSSSHWKSIWKNKED